MGSMYNGLCMKCGYQTELCLGAGLFSINLEHCSTTLPKDEQNKILEMKEKKEIQSFHIENYIAKCSQCQTLTGKMLIDVTDAGGVTHTFGKTCNTCGRKLTVYREWKEETVTCPKCKEKELVLTTIGHWD